MKTGKELIAEIDAAQVEQGRLSFWWLGQHSFVVKTAQHILYLDPYLMDTPERLVPPLLKPSDATNADFITGSHDHLDHIDVTSLPGMMAASPNAILVVPRACESVIAGLGIAGSRVRLLDDGIALEEHEVRITGLKAAHEFFDHDEELGYPYLGYVVETDGVVIYHAGDTCVYDGMAPALNAWDITVAFLPINGRDAKRLRANIIGNMTYQEAADLAGAITPRLTVPAHYEMFDFNYQDPRPFAEYMDVKYPSLKYWIGDHGTPVTV